MLFYSLTLGLLGPVISFFTLQTQTGYSTERAFLYSVVSFFADLSSVLVYACVLKKFLKIGYDPSLGIATVVYLPMWIFDIFDLNQELRFLSNLGLAVSLIILFRLLERAEMSSFRRRFALLSVWVLLYVLDAAISEAIASSPLTVKLLSKVNL